MRRTSYIVIYIHIRIPFPTHTYTHILVTATTINEPPLDIVTVKMYLDCAISTIRRLNKMFALNSCGRFIEDLHKFDKIELFNVNAEYIYKYVHDRA